MRCTQTSASWILSSAAFTAACSCLTEVFFSFWLQLCSQRPSAFSHFCKGPSAVVVTTLLSVWPLHLGCGGELRWTLWCLCDPLWWWWVVVSGCFAILQFGKNQGFYLLQILVLEAPDQIVPAKDDATWKGSCQSWVDREWVRRTNSAITSV